MGACMKCTRHKFQTIQFLFKDAFVQGRRRSGLHLDRGALRHVSGGLGSEEEVGESAGGGAVPERRAPWSRRREAAAQLVCRLDRADVQLLRLPAAIANLVTVRFVQFVETR